MREGFTTLIELLSTQASRHPDKPAFIFLDENAVEVLSVSYQELDQQSRTFAAALQARLENNSPVVLALDTGAQLVISFFGCIYAGMLPVILPPPRHKRDTQSVRRIERALALTKAKSLFVTPGQLSAMSTLFPACDVRNVDEEISDSSHRWTPPSITGATSAYLQFTSGSTAKPRGIVLTHENVLSNLELIRRVFQHDQDVVTVGWLPLHHDMGLVGHVLGPMMSGGTGVLLPPVAFVRDPLNWLRTISRYRAVSSAAPPFAYDLCTHRRGKLEDKLDLSCWTNACVGAEPVAPAILQRFAAAYAGFGFNETSFFPCYGLAEATLFVAGARANDGLKLRRKDGVARHLVGYSCADGDVDVRIVDPETGHSRSDGEVGEVWLTGASVAKEYFGDERATARTFVRPSESERYLRTGDLGFVNEQHLYVTGRLKDLIIVRGVNYYPEDIEETVRATREFCRYNAAVSFSVEGRTTEDLVILQEVKPATIADPREFFDAVREAIAEEHGLQVAAIVLVRAGSLPRTSSGKISRRACRNAYVDGKLREVAAWRNKLVHAPATRAERFTHEPIAIIGMACRFPGAESCDDFWSLLRAGGDPITEVPRQRWNADLFYDPRPAIPGKMNTRWGGFLNGIDQFDAEFFGITPPQATEMDPQQRLVLEVAWRAFENAGLWTEKLSGSDTGVFVGLSTNDYMHLQIKLKPDLTDYNAYSGLGNANSLSANLLSYTFNLYGPSVAVDTACSSSLTSVHLAARSLRNGECEIAIAGGVNTLLSPGTTVTLSQFNMMSPEGRCKVFDSSADGYVRSEGCGLVVLKRRSDALRDGDNIIAYLLGSAIGQNGRTTVITAPNAAAQQEVIQKALADAGCRPDEVTFVEAHGTGTVVGDPAEVEEIKKVYGGPSPAGLCYLGSVKANVGHLEAAAGIAGLIKLVLCIQHGEVPPQIHLNTLNSRISIDDSRIVIPAIGTRWSTPATRVGAVSSFGFGGANAHAIVAANEEKNVDDHGPTPVLFPLSAKTEAAWRDQAGAWVRYLRRPQPQSLPLLAYSQSVRRSHFNYRKYYVAATREELASQLEASLESQQSSPVSANQEERTIGFLFSGQGSQYAGMGRELYERFSSFRKNFDRCAAIFAAECPNETPLESIVFAAESDKLEDTFYLQPALFALEYALAKLLIAVARQPSLVLGHSLGEYVAACIAGCAEPEDMLRLVILRARLMASINTPGAMAATTATEADLTTLLETGDVCIAAVNAPNNTVISGPADQVAAIAPVLSQRGFAVRPLRTSQAFHSSLMDEVLDEFEAAAGKCNFSAPRVPLISNVSGREMLQAPDAAYWRKHLRSTVLFNKGLVTAHEKGINAWFEVGPGEVLLSCARQSSDSARPLLLPALDGRGEVSTLLRSLGELYCHGKELQWTELFDNKSLGYVPDLPGHPFYRKRYWFASHNGDGIQSARASEEITHSALVATYDHDWIKTELPEIASIKDDDHFILVGGAPKLTAAIAAELRRARAKVFTVAFSEHAGQTRGAVRFSLPPGCDTAAYAEVFREITSRHSRAGASRWHVLYLNGLECTPSAETSIASLERDQRLFGVGDLTAVVQALIPHAPAIRLWIVTANCQPLCISGDNLSRGPINLSQATLWGFAHTLFLERSEMRGGLIDLDPADDPNQQAAQVLGRILDRHESITAFRAGACYAPRLTPAKLPSGERFDLKRDGVYLITGGLGGLGLKCAEWMAQRGAGEIVLIGRSGLPDRAEWDSLSEASEQASKVKTIREIERAGTKVTIVAADVSDHARLSEIIGKLASGDRQLRGLVHAAGVNWFSKIADLDRERMLETLKTKVSAAWHLHKLTEPFKLDFFILFSSVSAVWGSVDLAHYTAANQFLTALAYERRRQGQHALTIDWGPWSEVGMSAKTNETHLLTMLGFRLLPPQQALATMEALLIRDTTRAVVADIDWEKFRIFIEFSSYPKLFETVWNSNPSARATKAARGSEADRIRSLPPAEARARLVELLQQQFASILLLEAGSEVDVDQRFNLMGMDSLMSITFALRLENLLHVTLPSALVYNYPTIREAADYLFEVIRSEKVSDLSEARPLLSKSNTRLWFPYLNGSHGASLRLFCFPYAGSGASIYRHWQELLRPSIEIVPVQLPGREDRVAEPALREMRELASSFVNALRELPPAPFAFFGHSMGALICFAVMCELRRLEMEMPAHLFVSACVAPNHEQAGVHNLPEGEFQQTLVTKFAMPQEAVANERWWNSIQQTLRCDINLLESYKLDDAGPLDVPVTVLGGADDPVTSRQALLDWSAFTTTDFSLRLFPGDHMYIKQHEAQVIEILQRELS